MIAGECKGLAPSERIWESSTFRTSCLDDCNSLYFDAHQSLLYCLQLFQYVAACPLTGNRYCDHITPVMVSLHWLHASFWIQFTILLPVFLNLAWAGITVSQLVHLHAPVRAIWSTHQMLLEIPRRSLKTSGGTAFAVAAPNLWNSQISETVNINTARYLEDFTSFLNLLALALLTK